MTTPLFADLVLPVPIPKLFTYYVPGEMGEHLVPGARVIVSFGKNKIVTGIVDKVHDTPPTVYKAKPILELLDSEPIVTPKQMEVLQWIARYYMCTVGEVVNAALPAGLKLNSESRIQLHPEKNWHDSDYPFDDKELVILKALEKNDSLTYKEAAELIELKSAYKYIKSLVQKETILIYEELKERYRPKKVKKVRLNQKFLQSKEALESLFKTLEKKPKQADILLKYLQEIPVHQSPEKNEKGILKSVFGQSGLSAASLQTLIKNEVLETFEEIAPRFETPENESPYQIELSSEQKNAQQAILGHFENKNTVLLHGITGSGKTEIYMSLIREALASGTQVLYLLPEIALTTQIVNRLKAIFGSQMAVYHSRFSDNERVEVWQGLLDGRFSFIVGVRSAVFLPFDNLGLIVVDEEHENSYKQFDPAPRYHARDVALYLAQQHGAKTILGSATPSLESYTNALQEKYSLVELNKRYGEAQLPEMIVANIQEERKRKTLVGHFSSTLVNAIRETLDRKEQVIIFQNRRGYSNYLHCETCGFIPACHRCAVSLTYHQYKNQLNCHYCGYKESVPVTCPACGSTQIKTIGFGTEKIEEDLQLLFPEASVERMDLETTRTKYAYQNIIQDFEKGKTDILVGTQMVSKGLDFNKVGLVGVFDTDRMIHFPDFRALERTFQLVTQVSGRAGRRQSQGKVIIQTADPQQPVIQKILQQDFKSFYHTEMPEREKYNYPPFNRMIKITLRHKDKQLTQNAASFLGNLLVEELGKSRVLGPHEPMINKIRDRYLMDLFLKIEKKYPINLIKEKMKSIYLEMLQQKTYAAVDIATNVDPY